MGAGSEGVAEAHCPEQVHASSAAPLACVVCVTSRVPSLSITSVPVCHLDIESSPEVMACSQEGSLVACRSWGPVVLC